MLNQPCIPTVNPILLYYHSDMLLDLTCYIFIKDFLTIIVSNISRYFFTLLGIEPTALRTVGKHSLKNRNKKKKYIFYLN